MNGRRSHNAAFLVLFAILSSTLSAQAPSAPAAKAEPSERLTADTPKAAVLGNAFVAPKDSSIRIKGRATILEAPEANSWIALVDVQADKAEQARAEAWKTYKPEAQLAGEGQ